MAAGLPNSDDTSWIIYNTTNSKIPSNSVVAVVIDQEGNKWVGTAGTGLAKFDGTNWTTYFLDVSVSGMRLIMIGQLP